jgi:hypothetical protein
VARRAHSPLCAETRALAQWSVRPAALKRELANREVLRCANPREKQRVLTLGTRPRRADVVADGIDELSAKPVS